jgi:hypothetical protein
MHVQAVYKADGIRNEESLMLKTFTVQEQKRLDD